MKKTTIIIIVLIAIIGFWSVGTYNGLVNAEEPVKEQWGNVENQYQRRADLIPNLVNTVKGYATHEKETLERVINARAKATQIRIDAEHLTPEALQQYQSTQGELTQALGKLLFLRENYPELKANQNFLDLQSQLEGTENRISVERRRFNQIAKSYNIDIRLFPKTIIAKIFGFKEKPYFQATEESKKAPEVKF